MTGISPRALLVAVLATAVGSGAAAVEIAVCAGTGLRVAVFRARFLDAKTMRRKLSDLR